MLHTKFRGNRPAGSGEEDFFKGFFTIYGHDGHLGHVTSIMSSDFGVTIVVQYQNAILVSNQNVRFIGVSGTSVAKLQRNVLLSNEHTSFIRVDYIKT